MWQAREAPEHNRRSSSAVALQVLRSNKSAGLPDTRSKPLANVGLLAAGLAASALLMAQQADAGVILEKPKAKKVGYP